MNQFAVWNDQHKQLKLNGKECLIQNFPRYPWKVQLREVCKCEECTRDKNGIK